MLLGIITKLIEDTQSKNHKIDDIERIIKMI